MKSPLFLWCKACGGDVTGSPKATLHVSNAEVAAAEDWDRARHNTKVQAALDRGLPYEQALLESATWNGGELFDGPGHASWAVHCDTCNPHRDPDGGTCGDCYWISLDRCATPGDLLEWTAHLMEKGWIDATDWSEFLRVTLSTNDHTLGV